jgi:hypothetical protein
MTLLGEECSGIGHFLAFGGRKSLPGFLILLSFNHGI